MPVWKLANIVLMGKSKRVVIYLEHIVFAIQAKSPDYIARIEIDLSDLIKVSARKQYMSIMVDLKGISMNIIYVLCQQVYIIGGIGDLKVIPAAPLKKDILFIIYFLYYKACNNSFRIASRNHKAHVNRLRVI